jgi:gliding motility-associated protein GldL
MGLYALVRTRKYRNFMAKLYGLGASVVIIGALFKINHYWGADVMLIIGLGTEACIFFFSAFEPPHVEPDWSLVYPQLAGIYHGDEVEQGDFKQGDSVTKELDKMLEKAKIGPELIQSLGQGLKTLTETTAQLTDVSKASVVSDQYLHNMKSATDSISLLTESYRKTAKTLEDNATVSIEQVQNIQAVSKNASLLSNAYAEASKSIKEELSLNREFSESIASVTITAKKFVEQYSESAQLLSLASETLSATTHEGGTYNKHLQKVSNNLSALNSLYELHIQSYGEQTDSTIKINEILHKLTGKLHESLENTSTFKSEMDALSKNIAALTKVYGNMLSAMNVTVK